MSNDFGSRRGCGVSSYLNFVIGGLVLVALAAAGYFVLVR